MGVLDQFAKFITVIFWVLVVLAIFGLWKVAEISWEILWKLLATGATL